MKKLIGLLLIVVAVTSCDVLSQMGEVKRFAECNFSVQSTQIVSLGNVDVSEYKSASDFNLSDMMILGQNLLSGKLKAGMEVNILARNNNTTSKASVSGLSWQLFMKNEQYGSGELSEYVEVLPGQSTVFPVKVEFDLLKIIKSDNIQTVINLVTDMDNREELEKLDISLKIKPRYKTASGVKEYPGYLTIRP